MTAAGKITVAKLEPGSRVMVTVRLSADRAG